MRQLKIQIIILLALFGLSGACSDESDPAYSAVVEEIQAPMEEGELLKGVAWNEDVYVLSFETKQVNVPVGLVQQVEADSLRWRTVLTLTNGSSYIIPSIGTSIDGLIANVVLNPSGYNPLSANVTMNVFL